MVSREGSTAVRRLKDIARQEAWILALLLKNDYDEPLSSGPALSRAHIARNSRCFYMLWDIPVFLIVDEYIELSD